MDKRIWKLSLPDISKSEEKERPVHFSPEHEIIDDKLLRRRRNGLVTNKLSRHSSLASLFKGEALHIPGNYLFASKATGEIETNVSANKSLPSAHGDNCATAEKESNPFLIDELYDNQQELNSNQNLVSNLRPHNKRKSLLFWRTSKSTECLDVKEHISPKVKLVRWPKSHRRAQSDPHLESNFAKAGYASDVNRGNRDNNVMFTLELEKTKIHLEMSRCIRTDDCKRFRSLLKKRIPDVNLMFDEYGSLMHDASYKGCTKCIKTLLKGGSSSNLGDSLGWTPLHAAVLGRNLNAIKLLIENKANTNQLNSEGLSPCHLGVLTDDIYIIHELMKAGGDPLVRGASTSPFQMAIDLRKNRVLDYFLHMSCFLVDNISTA